MFKKPTILFLLLISSVNITVAQESRLQTEGTLGQQLQSGTLEDRAEALQVIRAFGPESVSPALRQQLVEELQRVNVLTHSILTSSSLVVISDIESPEYIAQLHRVVMSMNDPDALPALANAMGIFTIVGQLTDWGEQAAPYVLDVVMDSSRHYSVVNDGLRVLRMMLENQTRSPLSAQTLSRIRAATEQRLTGNQYFTTVWYAIDLASVQDEPGFQQRLEAISTNSDELIALGITDPRRVERTQQHAADLLAGELPLPRREDIP